MQQGTRDNDATQALVPGMNRVIHVMLDGTHLATVPLSQPCITIGRASENDITLDDAGVSRAHAQILTVHGESVVEDLGSRNGTYVNYKFVKTRQIEPGDDIIIARYKLELRLAAEAAPREVSALIRKWRRGVTQKPDRPCLLCGRIPATGDCDLTETEG